MKKELARGGSKAIPQDHLAASTDAGVAHVSAGWKNGHQFSHWNVLMHSWCCAYCYEPEGSSSAAMLCMNPGTTRKEARP